MNHPRIWIALGIFFLSVAPVTTVMAAEPGPVVQSMCDYLKSLKQFSYQAEVAYDQPDAEGNKVQYEFAMVTSVRRPDKLRVDALGDEVNKQFFFNGRTITLYDKSRKMYATTDVPPDIEAALAAAHKKFDLRVALTDLASPDLCRHLTEGWGDIRELGLHKVDGVSAHHLVFDRKEARLQLWIDAGKNPLPLKVVITEKHAPGAPQWTAYLTHWNVSPKLNESLFAFAAPTGVERIDFLPVEGLIGKGGKK